MEHRATICLVAELQEAGGSLRVQGRELSRHGAARMHSDPAQKVFMRWLLATWARTVKVVHIALSYSSVPEKVLKPDTSVCEANRFRPCGGRGRSSAGRPP